METWKRPRTVVEDAEPVEGGDVALAALLALGISLVLVPALGVPGSLVGTMLGSLAGSGASVVGFILGGLLGSMMGLAGSVAGAARLTGTYRLVWPLVSVGHHATRVTTLDTALEALRGRAREDPELVGSVGRAVLAARNDLVARIAAERTMRDNGRSASFAERRAWARQVEDELDHVEEVLEDAHRTLDRAGVVGRATMTSKAHAERLEELRIEMRLRREVLDELEPRPALRS